MKILGIGDIAIDIIYECNDWPQIGSKSVIKRMKSCLGGMISNVIGLLGALGNEAYIVDDINTEDRKYIEEELSKKNVKMDYIKFMPNVETTKAIIMLAESERTIFIVRNDKKSLERDSNLIEKNFEYIYSTINDLKNFKNFIELKNNSKIVIDVEANNFQSYKTDKVYFDIADILFINEFGMEKLLYETEIEKLINHKDKIIVITKGSNGCDIITKEQRITIKGQKANVIDTTGAGDTFNGMFLHALSTGKSLEISGNIANYLAAKSTQHLGCKIITHKDYIEAEKFFKERS